MANLPDALRVVMFAASNGPNAMAMLELERLLIGRGNVQLVRFENREPFLEFMQDLLSLPPHFALLEASETGLECFEHLRTLETGRTQPAVLLTSEWRSTSLERAVAHHANSCVGIPSESEHRLEVFTALVTYWCAINEAAI